ncbi:MAG TPA: hypothetical protein VF432_19325 [Thermoanaerobaculia bacterium]
MTAKGGKYGKGASASASGRVTLTLSSSVAQDLYQALTIALSGGGPKGAAASAGKLGGKSRVGGKSSRTGKTAPGGKTPSRKGKTR